jgi:Zn-dependent M28 family amino/carboxypeptidase
VSSEVGARLARRFAGDELAVSVEATIGDATSRNVRAELGPETDERILVTSHVDAHDISEGAMDNGAGTATVVELANALADREDELDTRIEFVVYGAEEVGLVGSEHHAADADLDSIKTVVNNDGVVRGRTLEFHTGGFPELREAAEAVGERFDHPVETVPRQSPHSDHWPFVRRGVPGYHVMSRTGEQGRGWGHTYADTLDKVDVRNLREQAVLLTELVVHLADADVGVEHRSTEVIAADLEEQGLAEGMRVSGDWPFGD